MFDWKQAKDPSDADFYEVKIGTAWLGSDVIASVTFDVDPGSALNIAEPGINYDTVRTFISGGVAGVHPIEVTITTEAGRILQRTINLTVAEQ